MKNVCNFDLIFDFFMLKKYLHLVFTPLEKKKKKVKSILICICLKRGNS